MTLERSIGPDRMMRRLSGRGIEFGAFDYLMKPCELDELLAKIRKAVGRL